MSIETVGIEAPYYLYRFEHDVLTVEKIQDDGIRHRRTARHRLPVPIDPTLSFEQCLIFGILIHSFFKDGDTMERATTLARSITVPIAAKLPNRLAKKEWSIGTDDIRDAAILVMLAAKEAASGPAPEIEYLGGERRDDKRDTFVVRWKLTS